MAQKRMLNKSISYSKQVNQLSLKSQFIFTWIIPHLDDYGLIGNDPDVIKAIVFPMNKKITANDIKAFIEEAEELELIIMFNDCIEYPKFYEHQTISENKRSKSKFQKTPRNPKKPQENIGENNNPQPNIREDKLSKVKLREVNLERGDKSPTPSQIANSFFNKIKEQEKVVKLLVEKGTEEKTARLEISKFINYWTELNKSGTKQRWQSEKTFEVQRRLATWFNNIQKFSRGSPTGEISV